MHGILLLGRKSCIQDIKFKLYWVSKSIPAPKSQNCVEISGAQKPTWAKFLESEFFYLKRQDYIDITRRKINLWSHPRYTYSYNEIVDKIVFNNPKTG